MDWYEKLKANQRALSSKPVAPKKAPPLTPKAKKKVIPASQAPLTMKPSLRYGDPNPLIYGKDALRATDLASQVSDTLEPAFNDMRARRGLEPEMEEMRERRIRRMAAEMDKAIRDGSLTPQEYVEMWNDSPEELRTKARAAAFAAQAGDPDAQLFRFYH